MFSPRVKCLFLLTALVLLTGAQCAAAQAVNFGTVAMGQTSVAQPVTLTFTAAGSVASQLALTSGAQKQDFAVASGGRTGSSRPLTRRTRLKYKSARKVAETTRSSPLVAARFTRPDPPEPARPEPLRAFPAVWPGSHFPAAAVESSSTW